MPVSKDMVRKMVTMSQEMADVIDDYRFERRFKSESEALRNLINAGLAAEGVLHIPKADTDN